MALGTSKSLQKYQSSETEAARQQSKKMNILNIQSKHPKNVQQLVWVCTLYNLF